jgi:LuxR family quorum sensing-dependent transcriptional regulator
MDRRIVIEIFDQFELIDKATTAQGIVDTFYACLRRHGFSSCLITFLPGPHNRSWHREIIVDGWPEGWFECYQTQKHYLYDPCAKRSRETSDPFLWSEAAAGSIAGPAQLVMQEAAAFGLRQGICVPIFAPFATPAVVSVAGEFVDIPPSTIHIISALARQAFRALLSACSEPGATSVLSERERQILQWTGAGKTAWETSRILGLSEHTVNTHLRNVRGKLDAANITQAVVEAARRGEIQI